MRPAWTGGVRAATQPTGFWPNLAPCGGTAPPKLAGHFSSPRGHGSPSCGLHPPGRHNFLKLHGDSICAGVAQPCPRVWREPGLGSAGMEIFSPLEAREGQSQRPSQGSWTGRLREADQLVQGHVTWEWQTGTGPALALGCLPLIPAASEGVFQNVGIRTRGAGAWAARWCHLLGNASPCGRECLRVSVHGHHVADDRVQHVPGARAAMQRGGFQSTSRVHTVSLSQALCVPARKDLGLMYVGRRGRERERVT